MSTFPEHAEAFIAWASRDLAKAQDHLERHPSLIRSTNALGETALHYLAVEDRVAAVALLIARGAAVNTRDRSGATPLHHAAQLGYPEMVRLLLGQEADAEAVDENLETPLHYAARSKVPAEILDLLIQAGADVNASDGMATPLDVAVGAGREDLAAVLRAAGGRRSAPSPGMKKGGRP